MSPHKSDPNEVGLGPLFEGLGRQGGHSRRTDPETGREAGRALKRSGKLGVLQAIVLAVVRRFPGITCSDAWQESGIPDHAVVSSRLSELRTLGLVFNYPKGDPRRSAISKHSGIRQLAWWPANF